VIGNYLVPGRAGRLNENCIVNSAAEAEMPANGLHSGS
jgi:hypothetical protein